MAFQGFRSDWIVGWRWLLEAAHRTAVRMSTCPDLLRRVDDAAEGITVKLSSGPLLLRSFGGAGIPGVSGAVDVVERPSTAYLDGTDTPRTHTSRVHFGVGVHTGASTHGRDGDVSVRG